MKPSSSEFGITATTAIGWGQEEGVDEDTAIRKEGKKESYLKDYLAAIKRLIL